MSRRLLSSDPVSGVKEYWSYDPATDKAIIETVQDVEPYLDHSKRLANDHARSRHGIKNDMWHVACIPVVIQLKWLHDYGIDVYKKEHKQRVLKLLDSPEWKYLKTTDGKIGVPDCVKGH